jgi:hypothetical protein
LYHPAEIYSNARLSGEVLPERANTVRWDIDPGRNTVKLRDPASSVHKMAEPMLGCVGPQDWWVALR